MEEKIVYIVECSSGYWDMNHQWVAGVYENVIDAEILKGEIELKSKIMKESLPPENDYDDDYDEDIIIFKSDINNLRFLELVRVEVNPYHLNKSVL